MGGTLVVIISIHSMSWYKCRCLHIHKIRSLIHNSHLEWITWGIKWIRLVCLIEMSTRYLWIYRRPTRVIFLWSVKVIERIKPKRLMTRKWWISAIVPRIHHEWLSSSKICWVRILIHFHRKGSRNNIKWRINSLVYRVRMNDIWLL